MQPRVPGTVAVTRGHMQEMRYQDVFEVWGSTERHWECEDGVPEGRDGLGSEPGGREQLAGFPKLGLSPVRGTPQAAEAAGGGSWLQRCTSIWGQSQKGQPGVKVESRVTVATGN
jgi:hypothetical protein